jgi:hypothetical protein
LLGSSIQEFRSSGVQEFRSSGVQEFRSSGVQEFRSSGVQEFRSSGVQLGELVELQVKRPGRANMKCKQPGLVQHVSHSGVLNSLNSSFH